MRANQCTSCAAEMSEGEGQTCGACLNKIGKKDTRSQSLDYLDKYLLRIGAIEAELLRLIAILRAEVKGCPLCGRREGDK